MSGGSKQQFKQFTISSIQDAFLVLGSLISGVIVNLERYKDYASEAKSLFEEADSEYIQARDYEDIKDKLLFRQRGILKLMAVIRKVPFLYIFSGTSRREPLCILIAFTGDKRSSF